MALGFFVGIKEGVGRFMDAAGKVSEIPASRVPKNLKPGQDFNYRASSSGNFRIAEPVSTRTGKATNSPRDRQQYAVKHLMSKGWSAPQASGIVARLTVESYPDLRTNAVGDREIPGASHGIGQWNRERKAAMIAYTTGKIPAGKYSNHPLVKEAAAASPGNRGRDNFDAQLDFWDWEVRNSPAERIAYAAIRRAKTAEDAGTGMMHYERPRGYTSGNPRGGMHWKETVSRSANIMKQFDPNYTPHLQMTDDPKSVDTANIVSDIEQGDMVTAEAIGALDDPILSDVFGTGNDGEEDEDTFGETVSTASQTFAEESQPEDLSDDNWAFIQQMIQQGQQASQGSLPRLPMLGETEEQ